MIQLLTLAAMFFALTSSAATYYVRTNGNDSADGSYGTPWLTLAKAVVALIEELHP